MIKRVCVHLRIICLAPCRLTNLDFAPHLALSIPQWEGLYLGWRISPSLVWDRSAAKAVEWSASLVSERAMLSQIDAYVGGDGGWASGEVDPDEDDYPSSGGSDGDDFGADDY